MKERPTSTTTQPRQVEIVKPLRITEPAGHRYLGERSFVVTCRGPLACPPGCLSGQAVQSVWAGEGRAVRITLGAFTTPARAAAPWLAKIVTFR